MDEEILFEWNPWWGKPWSPELVEREATPQVEKWLERKEVLPLTGSRRSGKTTLMYQLIARLLSRVPTTNILFVKCDDDRVLKPNLIERAREKHAELFNPEGRVYLFLDEVQEVKSWDKTVKRIYDLSPKYKILLTGSRLLKAELSSSLAGRFVHFPVYPFSFREFLQSRGVEVRGQKELLANSEELKHLLREYIEWGGFPEIVLEKDKEKKRELLRFYSDSILYRDVIKRSRITKVDRIELMKNYFLTNISNLTNNNRLAKQLGLSPDTVAAYAHAMESAYYIFSVPFLAYSVKKQQANPKKIYCIDNGIRNVVSFRFSSDVGRLYENAVFLHLKRRYDEIFYWKKNGLEVDFVIKEGQMITKALQVCYDVDMAGEREPRSLVLALKEFKLEEGLIITGNRRETRFIEGKRIRWVPLWEWLLEK